LFDLPVETCKRGWKSLKDGLRYRSFGNKVKKSGDSGDEGEFDEPEYSEAMNDNALESWCFWDDLKFLSEARPGRRYSDFLIDQLWWADI